MRSCIVCEERKKGERGEVEALNIEREGRDGTAEPPGRPSQDIVACLLLHPTNVYKKILLPLSHFRSLPSSHHYCASSRGTCYSRISYRSRDQDQILRTALTVGRSSANAYTHIAQPPPQVPLGHHHDYFAGILALT